MTAHATMKPFTRGGWSFRPHRSPDGHAGWEVFRPQTKRATDSFATLIPASDRRCWVFSIHGRPYDARDCFETAVEAVVSFLNHRYGANV